MKNVFTYGSLMFPEVWRRVTGGRSPGQPARLEGFGTRRLAGQTYPVIVTAPGGDTDVAVEGVLYTGVEAEALARLDLFEGGFYVRRTVTVVLAGGGTAPAEVYAAADEKHPDILPERWRAEEFRDRHLADFLSCDPGFEGPR